MSSMSKEDYITRSLSKLDFKRWELYVVTRIFHRLNDPEIEFVFQQPVRNSSTRNPYLVDLFFPQFGLYLEVDEEGHASDEAKRRDAARRDRITKKRVNDEGSVDADFVHLTEKRIATFTRTNGQVIARSLQEIDSDIEEFITELRVLKCEYIESDTKEFQPWDLGKNLTAEYYTTVKKVLEVKDRPRFRTQLEALRCFGYQGGARQRAIWPSSPDKYGWQVWFVRVIPHKTWANTLSEDGTILTETLLDKNLEDKQRSENREGMKITFARRKDLLNQTLYEYIGVFRKVGSCQRDENGKLYWKYVRQNTKVDLPQPNLNHQV